jgi:hypothetical protein
MRKYQNTKILGNCVSGLTNKAAETTKQKEEKHGKRKHVIGISYT